MSRTGETKITLEMAAKRLKDWGSVREISGRPRKRKLWPASMLAEVIWPQCNFHSNQGAGAAASRVLRKIGAKKQTRKGVYGTSTGWNIEYIEEESQFDT